MLLYYLDYIVPGSILLPLLTATFAFKTFPVALKVLFFYLLTSALINTGGIVLVAYHRPNLWLLHIYTIVEAVFLLLFFHCISPLAKIKTAVRILLVIFPVACIINMLAIDPASRFNSYPRSAEALIFIFLGVIYWLRSSETHRNDPWTADPYNWLISGIILYFSASFSLFLFSDIMLTEKQANPNAGLAHILSLAWGIHGTLVIIQYMLFAVGFSKYKK